ncbi:MAG: c-type cytochrome [Bacteroidetes bacterium]|nr:c-type cytochrome [Bacteroidota bacterium]
MAVQAIQAQTAPVAAPSGETDMNLYFTVLFIVVLIIFHAVFIPMLFPEKTTEELAAAEIRKKKKSVIGVITDKISGLKPMEAEKELLMSDNYDGIQELDNNIPPWFNILFYGTVIIAIVYLLNYHVFKTGKLPFQEYNDEVYAAEVKREELIRTGAFINEESVEQLKDAESLAKGKQIFLANCVPCHGNNAEGTVGPNLTDDYWIHGGGIKNIFKTVKYGVPVKGMIAWQSILNPKSIQEVGSYVISLHGTNPPNGKAPEGDKYSEKTDSTKAGNDSLKNSGLKTDSLKEQSLKNDKAKTDSVKK